VTDTPDSRRLLTDQELAESGPAEAIPIPIGLVDANAANPREHLPEIDVLAASIVEFGLMQPILVRRSGERYEVISGHRRRAAYLWLREQQPFETRWLAIPAVVRTEDDEDRALRMLISSQLDTRAWRPREEASMLERLMVSYRSLKRVGEALHRTESWASKRLRIYADSVLSAYVQSGRLLPGVAEELLPVLNPELRKEFAERAVAEGWSQEQARSRVRALRAVTRLADLDKKVLELVDVLSSVNRSQITIGNFRNLQVLRGRIESLEAEARGEAPKMPSIAEAERAAGVTERQKTRAERERLDQQRLRQVRARRKKP
jgi:ParB/RepB/Spo0J family partition protein